MSSDRNRDSAGTALSDGEIIDRFGGIRPMAAKLGVAFTTVQGWKVRGRIPEGRRQAILDAAGSHGIDLGGAVAPAESPAPGREAKPAPVTDAPPPEPAPEQPPEPPRKESAQPETHAGEPPGGAEPGPAPVAKPAPPPRGGAGIAWLALLVALAVGVALVARPWWEPLIHPPAPAPGGSAQSAETVAEIRALSRAVERLSGDLAGRLETLEGRIAAVERTGGGGGDLGPQLAALERSLTSLASGLESISATLSGFEVRIGALELASTADSARVESALRENAAALAALGQELAALDASRADTNQVVDGLREGLAAALEHAAALGKRVGELETRPVQTGEKIAALALAIGQVEAAFDSGRPYRSALNRLEAIARDDPLILESGAIAALAPWADRGIDSRSTLQRRFARIAPDITVALAKTDSVTWIDRIWDSVSTIVTVRRVEGSEDLSPVSRAEAALANDDLAAAAAAFKGLESLGEAGDAWLAMAERRIRAEREIAALYAQVIQPLAGPAPAAGSRETAAPDTGFGESAAQ